MEKGQVVKVALGVGVIGSALAYLAYTKYKEMDSEPQEDTTDATQGVEQEMQTIKQEVKSVIDSAKNTKIPTETEDQTNDAKTAKAEEKATGWGQFWKSEYEAARTGETE